MAEKHDLRSRDRLSFWAIRALFWIIMTSLFGIITINIVGTLIQADLLAGLFGGIEQNPDAAINTDEALSILGNLGSAAVGGLVGWLTRDYLEASDKKDRDAELAEAELAAVTPAAAPIVEEGTTMTEYDPDLEDGPEEEFVEDVEDVEVDEAETEALMQDEPEPEPDEVEPDEVKS